MDYNSILEQLNSEYAEIEGAEKVEQQPMGKDAVSLDERWDEYVLAKNENLVASVKFETATPEGNLIYYNEQDGIQLVLRNEDVRGDGKSYSAFYRSSYVGRPIMVCVVDIDKDNSTVYVSAAKARDMIIAERKPSQEELAIEEKLKSLSDDEMLVVPAKVASVAKTVAVVYLFGKPELKALLTISQFSDKWIRDYSSECHVGETYQVEVTGRAERGFLNPSGKMWKVSRLNMIPSKWAPEILAKYPVGAVVIVRCTEVPDGKGYFWGRIQGVEVELLVNKSTSIPNPVVGGVYKAVVRHNSSKDRIFQASAFECLTNFKNNEPLFRRLR